VTGNPAANETADPGKSDIGADGFIVLAASLTIMALSLGGTLLLALGFVAWVATRASCDSRSRGRIVVPGMRLGVSGQLTHDYEARIARAVSLWSNMRSARIVILGGRTSASLPSEAQAGCDALRMAGVPTANLIVEDQSRHTLENLRRYRSAFADSLEEPVLLVTNRFHLARCSLLAAGLGIPHLRCPAEERRLPGWRQGPRMLFEAILIHWYMTGRILAALPGGRRLSARIR
jgi:uncharacterized SAM-binding protein YcdF (DUF218 family)